MDSRLYIHAVIVQARAFGPVIVAEARAVPERYARLGVRVDPTRGTYSTRALRRSDRPRRAEITLPVGEGSTLVALDEALLMWAIARIAAEQAGQSTPDRTDKSAGAALDALMSWVGIGLAVPCDNDRRAALDTEERRAPLTPPTRQTGLSGGACAVAVAQETQGAQRTRRRRRTRGGRKHRRVPSSFNTALERFVEAHGLVEDRPGRFTVSRRAVV